MQAEREFVGRLRQHEEHAVQALVDEFFAPIHRYLFRLVGDRETAEDLTQETFLRAYRALPRLAEDSNLNAWLYTIATNLARKHQRRQQVIRWIPLARWHARANEPTDQVAEREEVHQALHRLSAEYRTCLLLHTWAGLSCAEIGQAVGKSEAAVKMILVRARRQFRAAYEQDAIPVVEE